MLEPNLLVLGTLEQQQLARFYNLFGVFIYPSLTAQATGFVSCTIEAMLSGVMATIFASIIGTLIVGPDIGRAFSLTVHLLEESFHRILDKEYSWRKVRLAETEQRGSARKMASACESLVLCVSGEANVKANNDYRKAPISMGLKWVKLFYPFWLVLVLP